MSFLNITDPKRRDALVREYATSLQTIQQRNRNERLQNTTDERELTKIFSPMVKANEAVSTTVKNEINPLKRDLLSLTDSIKENTREQKRIKKEKLEEEEEEDRENDIASYYLRTKTTGIDHVYGIFTNSKGTLQMGVKDVYIQNNNIIVDDVTYQGTEGLWSLVMDTKPQRSVYTNSDVEHYKELIKHTEVIFHPHKIGSRSRPRTLTKWTHTIDPLLQENEDFFDVQPQKEIKKDGTGICGQPTKQVTFLPGDLAGLQTKMKLLLAEFLAGNKTTKNELVHVLDELKRRTKISKNDYTKINSLLASK
jgi:hypothetical protein